MFRPRHSGSRGTETSSQRCAQRAISATVCSGSGTCSSTSIAVASVELVVGERQVLGLHDLVLEVRRRCAWPTRPGAPGRRGRCRRCAPSPRRCAHSCVSTPSPQPTSRSECGAAWREQLVERALEARHQPPDDRVGRAVLVVGVAGDRALGVDGDVLLTASPPPAPRSARAGAARRSSPAGRSARAPGS